MAHFYVGEGSVVLPHTIIDLMEPVEVPAWHVVWGHVTCRADLATRLAKLSTEDLETLAKALAPLERLAGQEDEPPAKTEG